MLERLFEEKVQEEGLSKRKHEVYERVNRGKSAIYKTWSTEKATDETYRNLANFIGIDERVAKYLNESQTVSNGFSVNDCEPEQARISPIKKTGLAISIFTLIGLTYSIATLSTSHKENTQRIALCDEPINFPKMETFQTSLTHGFGEDLDPKLTHVEFNNFNPALYEYRFDEFTVETIGEYVEVDITMQWFPKNEPEKALSGHLRGCGMHFDGKAAIAYKVTDTKGTQEEWIGTFMMDMPRSGSVHGYFLTSHSDLGKSLFALGSLNATR